MQLSDEFNLYKTVDGKFSDQIGPYYYKNDFPDTIFAVEIKEKQTNLRQVAHGGFLMAFADSVGGYFAYKATMKPSVTVNLNSNFISPVPINSLLEAKGNVLRKGKRTIFVSVEMFVKKKLVFCASGVWQIINIENAKF